MSLTIDDIVWMGTQPTLHEKASMVGISDTRPAADLAKYLRGAKILDQRIHYLPPIVRNITCSCCIFSDCFRVRNSPQSR